MTSPGEMALLPKRCGEGEGVKGRSRPAGARSAALEALPLTAASSERRGSDGELSSVPAIAARRRDRRQSIEVEFNNGLERVGGRGATQRLWQGLKPGGVGGLKRQQFGNRVVPALWPGPPLDRLAQLNNNDWSLLVTVAVARLPFGDVLMWDECATMHRGAGDYRPDERRIMLRTIVYPH